MSLGADPSKNLGTSAGLSLPLTILAMGGRRQFANYANAGQTSRSVVGALAGTPQGTIGSAAEEAEGHFQPWTTAATTNAAAGGSVFGSSTTVQRRWGPIAAFRFKTGASLATLRLAVGLATSGTPSSSADPSGSHILLRHIPGTDTGWVVATKDGATQTVSASVGAIAADTAYLLVIDCRPAAAVNIWLGSNWSTLTLIHTATANLPANSTGLQAVPPHVTTLENVAKSVKYSHVEVSHA